MIDAVDCQGFAGGFTLGAVQAGFHLVGKREMVGGFGVANCEANRHLLGDDWTTEAVEPEAWSVPMGGADVVFGNPPCSGFSGLSNPEWRGVNSPANECMWALVDYSSRVMPQVVVFESVRAAYSKGRTLMQDLRTRLEERTGHYWNLHHVIHDAHALGGPAVRRRYFWVASRVPFGVEHPDLPTIPTFWDAISDLEPLGHTWLPQPYRSPASEWSSQRRSIQGVVDGQMPDYAPFSRRITDLANMIEWPPGQGLPWAARRCYEEHGRLPDSWPEYMLPKMIDNGFNFGFNAIHRWDPSRPARVITGAGPQGAVHPTQNRVLSYREVARIMGFCDDWNIYPLREMGGLRATWGKGITVDAGRWIATWVRRSLEGEPGSLTGQEVGDREYEITVSKPRLGCGSVITASTSGEEVAA